LCGSFVKDISPNSSTSLTAHVGELGLQKHPCVSPISLLTLSWLFLVKFLYTNYQVGQTGLKTQTSLVTLAEFGKIVTNIRPDDMSEARVSYRFLRQVCIVYFRLVDGLYIVLGDDQVIS